MPSVLRSSLPALILVAATFCCAPAAAVAEAEIASDEVAPLVAFYEYKRLGNSAFTFLVPTDWVALTGETETRARLEFVANLREVLDAPPDVPPGSFDQLLSFVAFWIPQIEGYMIATVFDTTAYPVQLFDVLHEHARGSNDWGKSLYIRVEDVLRNRRGSRGGNPALSVDVAMSGNLTVAAEYFQVPSTFNRIGGIVFLLPSDNWSTLAPLVDHLRDSIRVGASHEPPIPQADVLEIDEVAPDAVPEAAGAQIPVAGDEVPLRRAWNPVRPEDENRYAATRVLGGLVIIAIAYPLIFLLTLRLIYFAIYILGSYVTAAIDLDAYRKAADANPWTMGLLTTERMIMLCALASIGLAAALLAVFLQQS